LYKKELGENLFLRRKDGLILTKSGEFLLLRGQKICDELESVSETLKTGHSQSRQTLTIGLHPSVAAYTLPKLLKHRPENHPLELNFKLGLSREVTEWIQEGKIDCGIVINPHPHSNLIINPIEEDNVTLWSHKNRTNEDILFYDPQIHQTHSLLRQLEKKGIQFTRQLAITNLELIAKLVYEGAGVGVLPEKVIKNFNPTSTIPFSASIKPFIDKICFVYPLENKGLESINHLKLSLKKILIKE
jgi:DNA-binding transcriptional LysR family regulator